MTLSSFDPEQQNLKIESKIVVALERISEAFRVLLWNKSKDIALSPIQIQILIFLLFHAGHRCKVGYLANEFNMTKATISDSIKVLLQKNLIQKTGDENDSRSFTMSLTEEGQKIAENAASFANVLEKPLNTLSDGQKQIILNGLLKFIHELSKAGIITIQRMCFSCANYSGDNNEHYCKLLQTKLIESELRLDCPEHRALAAF